MRTRTKTSTRGPYNTLTRLLAPSWIAGAAGLLLLLSAPERAGAQDAAPPRDPPRYLAFGSAGVPLRLTVDEEFGQERRGATFADVLLGYVFPGGDGFRHGVGFGVSWNIGHDGGYTAPIYWGDQIAIMPAYLSYLGIGRDLALVGHVGIPIVVRGGAGPGLELGAALGYHLFAGGGLFIEADLAGYDAGEAGLTLLASLEAGLMLNYEVLP